MSFLPLSTRVGDPVVIQDATNPSYKAAVDASSNLAVKAASNSGVDIGDVDVLSIAAGTNTIGAVSAATKTLTEVCSTVATSGSNSLVAAPAAGTRIVVCAFVIQNESSTATTMILEDGTTDKWRCLGQNQGDGLAMVFAAGREWRLTAATALQLNLSGNNSCGYSISYFTETV